MKALDLFCGAGGASKGLADAGFDVTGVDLHAQPRYIHGAQNFIQADAMDVLSDTRFVRSFDFVAASPPCQHYSFAAAKHRNLGVEYPDLVEPVRGLLDAAGVPYAIENVPGAPLRADLTLTGPMFGLRVLRRRIFELGGWFSLQPSPIFQSPRDLVTVAGHWFTKAEASEAMEIYWMNNRELAQAVPPAYSRFIAREFLRTARAAA